MQNTKLINVCIYIHQEGKFRQLQKFLGRQYEQNDLLELKLWEHLKRYIGRGSYQSNFLKQAFILETLFDNDKRALNGTASRLYSKIKNYMVEDYLSENSIMKDWLFRESLKGNKNRLLELETEKLINDDRKPKTRIESALQLFIKFHLNYEKYQEESLKNSDVRLFNKTRELFREYYTRYHKILEAERFQRNKMFKEDIVPLVDLKYDEQDGLSEPEILFEKAKRLEENPNMEDFNDCKDRFLKMVEGGKVSREMELALFSEIMNFANRQSKKGNKEYFFLNIDYFIDLGLDKKILYVNNKIPIYIYVNFLSLVAGHRKLKDIKNYAYQHKNDVDDTQKADFFSTLFIEFYSQNYQTVIDIININENNISIGFDYSNRIRIWVFLMCSYFEVKDEEALMKAMNSFRRYLKSQTSTELSIVIYGNLIRFIREIFKADTIDKLNEIETKLANEKLITYEAWLNEKIKESRLRLTKG